MEILDVNVSNVDELGFFCYMSKKKSEGYQRKLAWVKERFAEGLRIKLLKLPDRGFIEYMPAEKAWRAVNADGYMVIHCLWIVGKSKKQGHGKALLKACLEDARAAGKKGVAVVCGGNWLTSPKFFAKQGFVEADRLDPSFTLMAFRFDENTPLPSFPDGWEDHAKKAGNGLTIYRTDQCPYITDAVAMAEQTADKAGVACNVVELESSEQVRKETPTPFGVFGLVQDGCLLSYHYQLEKDLLPKLKGK
ncbi:hypothetical protein KQI63_00905 [bacterium]|nr:hypothetical protein [bacterium]